MDIASILCWVLGVLHVGGGISLGIAALTTGRPIAFPLIIGVLGLGLCYCGYGVRKRQLAAGILAIFLSVASLLWPPGIGLVFGLGIITLIVTHWKQLA